MRQALFHCFKYQLKGWALAAGLLFCESLSAAKMRESRYILATVSKGFQAVKGLGQILADGGSAVTFHEEDIRPFCGFGTGQGQGFRSRRRIGYGRTGPRTRAPSVTMSGRKGMPLRSGPLP